MECNKSQQKEYLLFDAVDEEVRSVSVDVISSCVLFSDCGDGVALQKRCK